MDWKKDLAMMTEILFAILPQCLWYEGIQVDRVSVHCLKFSEKSINSVLQLFSDNGSFKKWHEFKRDYNLHKNSYFKWLKLIDSIPERLSKKTMKMLLILSFMIIT